MLDQADCRLLTLVGVGGIGKTRLAIEAAQELLDDNNNRSRFRGDVFVVFLQAVTTVTDMIAAILEEIGIHPHGNAPVEKQLIAYLRAKSMLIVLDNFERLMCGMGTDTV